MDKIISEIVTSVGRYFVIMGYFFDEVMAYKLIFRDRFFKIIKDESYKYSFFIYTETFFYFTISFFDKIDHKSNVNLDLRTYISNFETGKIFILNCLCFLLLIKKIAFF